MPTLPAASYQAPQYPTVPTPGDAGTPYQSAAAATPAAFGGAIGDALTKLSTQAETASNNFDKIAERQSLAAAVDQTNKVQQRFDNLLYGDPDQPGDTGALGARGQTFLNNYPDVQKQLGQVIQGARQGLDPLAAQHFDEKTRAMLQSARKILGTHYEVQSTLYQNEAFNSAAKLNEGSVAAAAASGNDQALDAATTKSLSDAATRGTALGLPPEMVAAQQAQIKQHAVKEKVLSLAAKGDATSADAFLERNAPLAGADYPTLKAHLKPALENQQAASYGAQIWGGQAPSAASVNLTGPSTSGNAGDTVAATLKARGFTPAAIQGVLNNSITESSLNPNAVGGAGEVGLFQFHPSTHLPAFKQAYGGDMSPKAQANYVADVVQRTMPGFAQTTDPRDATAQFLYKFERPKDQSDRQLNARLANSGASQAIVARAGGDKVVSTSPDASIVAIGDSLAGHVIRKAGALGSESGRVGIYQPGNTAVAGYNPQQILSQVIPGIPAQTIAGKTVALSTGISNSDSADAVQQDIANTVPQQIQALKDRGAKNIVLMGVGTDPKLAGANDQLAQIAQQNGVQFAGAQRATGGDKIHSTNQNAELAAVKAAVPTTGTTTPVSAIPISQAASIPSSSVPNAPDLDGMLAKADALVADGKMSPEVGEKTKSFISSQYRRWTQQTAQERGALGQSLTDGVASLAAGHDYQPDIGAIHRLLPAEKADQVLQQLNDARDQGAAVNQVRFAEPAEIESKFAQIQAGLNDPTNFAKKQRYAQAFSTAVTQRQKALADDPAMYVAAADPVRTAYQAVQNAKPEDQPAAEQAAISASLAEQSRLGVPAEQQHVLTKDQATSLAAKISTTGPDKADLGTALDSLATAYGPHWPRAFGDLVKAGLPGEAQILASMSAPEQASGRAEMQRAINLVSEKGGSEKLKEAVGQSAKDIDAALPDKLAAFRSTIADPTLFATYATGIKHLAYLYAYQGADATTALTRAYNAVLGQYEFKDQVRAPTGLLAPMQRVADATVKMIQPEQVADPGPSPDSVNLTPEQRKQIELSAIQRGHWAMTQDGTGWVRMAVRRDGASLPAIVNGLPVIVNFDTARKLPAPTASTVPIDVAPSPAGLQ